MGIRPFCPLWVGAKRSKPPCSEGLTLSDWEEIPLVRHVWGAVVRTRTLVAVTAVFLIAAVGLTPVAAQAPQDPIVGTWELDNFHVEVVPDGSGFIGTAQETGGCYQSGQQIWRITGKKGDVYSGLHPIYRTGGCDYLGDRDATWTLSEAGTRVDVVAQVENSGPGYSMYKPIDCDQPNAICGDDEDNQIVGTSGDDIIDAGEGNDTIDGGGGQDIIVGGEGDDAISGGSANDRLAGGPGNDALVGDAVAMPMATYSRFAALIGLQEENPVPGADILEGGEGDDTIEGNEGNDKTDGGPGGDKVAGGGGKDQVIGKAGNDDLDGNGGPDLLKGGGGVNQFDGGPGKDHCVLENKKDKKNLKSCEKTTFNFTFNFFPAKFPS